MKGLAFLTRLKQSGLKLRLKMRNFFQMKMKLFGHKSVAEGIATDSEKSKAVVE